MRDPIIRQELAERGVHFTPNAVFGHDSTPESKARYQRMRTDYRLALDAFPHIQQALDAQPGLVTSANAGVLLSSVSVIDPEVVRGGEAQKGSWVDQIAYFPMAESTGQVASYNDYSSNGDVDVNAQWNYRQPYTWQAFKRYGENQLARWGAAGLNYASELDTALAIKFAKVSNKSYFYGITGLVNYGLLNDPSLITAISPATKANTGQGVTWLLATPIEVFNDFKALYTKLNVQMGYNLEMDSPMTLVTSTNRQPQLSVTNDFGVTAKDMIQKSFPNVKFEVAPEYSTVGGELMQLIVTEYEGVKTAYPAYTEKLRAHALVTESSAWSQKNSAGTWGTILRRPIAVGQMLGI
jgi:hypothetical protein